MNTIYETGQLNKHQFFFFIISFCFAFSLLLSGIHIITSQQEQAEIASQILRLHVVANSSTTADQAVKLKVRDAIIVYLQTRLKNADSPKQAAKIVKKNIPLLSGTAEKTLRENGCLCNVKVGVKKQYFPVKTYGDLTFPAGVYNALCVDIGEAKGHNWWCVLFPSLCFVNETYAVVPKGSKQKLKARLSKKSYTSLQAKAVAKKHGKRGAKVKIEIHSALYDWFR